MSAGPVIASNPENSVRNEKWPGSGQLAAACKSGSFILKADPPIK